MAVAAAAAAQLEAASNGEGRKAASASLSSHKSIVAALAALAGVGIRRQPRVTAGRHCHKPGRRRAARRHCTVGPLGSLSAREHVAARSGVFKTFQVLRNAVRLQGGGRAQRRPPCALSAGAPDLSNPESP